MKVEVLTKDLAKALNTACRFVSPRANLPVLSNIVLKVEGSKLSILSTDLEISFATHIGAKVENDGGLGVPAKAFSEIISNLGTKVVQLEVKGEALAITSESFKSVLSGVNISDFPKVKTEASEGATALQAKNFIPALQKVLFSVGIDESRPTLTGVLFFMNGQNLVLVGTDGFRLSQKTILGFATEIPKVIIPKRVLFEVTKLFVSEFQFEYLADQSQVVFSDGETTLTSRTIDGAFPNFERIIPKEIITTVSVSTEDLSRSIKLASVFARDNANTVKLSVLETGVTISAESSKSGTQETSLEVKVEGSPVEILLNCRYIEEFMSCVSGESVTLKFTNPQTPSLFLDPKDMDFIHVIAPVRS